MATKENLRKYLEFFENDVRASNKATCPIVINFCDASANGKRFSEATVDISVIEGFPLAYIQFVGSQNLLSYLEEKSKRTAEISRLEEFIENKQHMECLLSLDGNKEYNEHDIKVIFAAHLFGPLAGSYKIGNKGFPKDARKCPKCGLDTSENLKNTSLGNGEVWHGYADILVNRSVVKITSEYDEEVGSSEPLQKKMRTGSIEDDESSTADEEYVCDSVVEEKKDAITCHAMSQVLSQTIVNAYAEVNKDQTLFSNFIPSFIATSQIIRITMYNCGLDFLLLCDDLDLFMYDKGKPIINITTILSVWYALNFENYFDKSNELFLYYKSNFKEQAGKMFDIYKEKCTKPMTETGRNKVMKFEISLQSCINTPPPVINVIKKSRSLLRNALPA